MKCLGPSFCGVWRVSRHTLSASLSLSFAAAATHSSNLLLIMVMSAPLSTTPSMGVLSSNTAWSIKFHCSRTLPFYVSIQLNAGTTSSAISFAIHTAFWSGTRNFVWRGVGLPLCVSSLIQWWVSPLHLFRALEMSLDKYRQSIYEFWTLASVTSTMCEMECLEQRGDKSRVKALAGCKTLIASYDRCVSFVASGVIVGNVGNAWCSA